MSERKHNECLFATSIHVVYTYHTSSLMMLWINMKGDSLNFNKEPFTLTSGIGRHPISHVADDIYILRSKVYLSVKAKLLTAEIEEDLKNMLLSADIESKVLATGIIIAKYNLKV